MQSREPFDLDSTSSVKKKNWFFPLWHPLQKILKKLWQTLQKWLGLRSFQSSAFEVEKSLELDSPSVPWTSTGDHPNPVPHPIDFLKGINDFPEFSYWSNQDLRNSVWDVYTPLQPHQSVVANFSAGLSLSELTRGFQEGGFQEEGIEEANPLKPSLQPSPIEHWNGLQTIPDWTNLSAGKLLETIDWERSDRKIQTASKDDLNLLGDLLAELPE